MFRLIVALLLINSYSGSWGAPTQNDTMLLSTSLDKLANSCESSFLVTQMKSRIKDCEVPAFPYHKKQIECLLFYDISSQLCAAVASSELALREDYTSKIVSAQDVSQLCNIAKDWTFTNMSIVYNQTVNSLFRDPLKCLTFCMLNSDTIFSVDSTFYCKYYKWGWEMLKSPINKKLMQEKTVDLTQTTNEIVSMKNSESNAAAGVHESGIEKSISSQDVEVKPDTSELTLNTLPSNNANPDVIPADNKIEASSTSRNQQEHTEDNGVIKKPQPGNHIPAGKEEQMPAVPKDLIPKKLTPTTGSLNGGKKIKNEEPGIENKHSGNQDVNLKAVEHQKLSNNADPDDYQPNDPDSGEVRDGPEDTQGGDDPEDGLDTKLDEEFSKKTIGINEPPVYNNDIAPKETYSNTIPEFDEEDDHFFPFFLTAIIMIVLLYILYHNKNKVSKVFLGLIVEGRQSGRRRNSRGPAYRRLDTLEQAMSTNAAAPPSKIIY